jgi:hypothetical protein
MLEQKILLLRVEAWLRDKTSLLNVFVGILLLSLLVPSYLENSINFQLPNALVGLTLSAAKERSTLAFKARW